METEYHATVGEITADGTVRPKPIDTSFLDRMKSAAADKPSSSVERADDDVHETAMETPMFLQIEDEDSPVEVPVEPEPVVDEIPVEETVAQVQEAVADVPAAEDLESSSFLERVSSPRSRMKKAEEFFIEDEPVVDEIPVEEASEEDDYSWITFEEEDEPVVDDIQIAEPAVASISEEVQEVVISEAPAEPESFEIPVEAPAIGDVQNVEPVMSFVEAPIEEVQEVVISEAMETPAEPESVIDASVETMEVQEAEAPVEVPAEEAPAEEDPVQETVAVMSLPGIREVEPLEPIAGLEMEGSEPSSDSAVSENLSAVPEVAEVAVTGSAVEPMSAESKFVGLEEDGEAYPRLSDPVVKRPRTVRFRFNNGVLQNVESEKTEPKEELRDPLA